MSKIGTCLWFDGKAEEAAKFYVKTFPGSKLRSVTRYGKTASQASGNREGSVMTVWITVKGQDILALNGGPQFRFSPAVSMVVYCDTQKEIDVLWRKLSSGGGSPGQCGWLTDRYGVSWQIVPARLERMLSGGDAARVERIMAEVVRMTKLDVKRLERAARGRAIAG